MKLVIATNNQHKVNEIKRIVSLNEIELLSLKDLNLNIEIEETEHTLEGNALLKAEKIFKLTNLPTVSDDTGLFVDALNGEPGVFSSRYAGENATYDDNCNKLLSKLISVSAESRNAYFKTVVCLFLKEDGYYFFEGVVKGKVTNEKRGTNGFGYDPIFIPDGYSLTYAEMPTDLKNQISHRAIAFRKLRDFLLSYRK
ncbi:MAG: RdgB/HAM1 family non-canonical purine NTP pyrophosphatase [Ignavibacteria bacterium]|nr:RdgB/HAM1 family non-canonical purine NTP pyrophosphatase [Ignavibacteria bacterium]